MVENSLRQRIESELPAWSIEGEELVRTLEFPDFAGALAGAVHVGSLAQRADHHPELRLGWGRLEIRLTTHSSGGISTRDVELARAIDAALA